MNEEVSLWNEIAEASNLKHGSTKKALVRQLKLCANSPTGSSTQAAGRSSGKMPWNETIATYRFMNNKNASLKALREFRREVTLANYPKGNDVLIMNDVSLLDYYHHDAKEDRRRIGDGKGKGYEYICNLAVNPENGAALGVVHDCLVNKNGPDDQDMVDYSDEHLKKQLDKDDMEKIKENHRHQMTTHIRASEDFLEPWNAIHVGDREFDDIFIMLATQDEGHEFVLRATDWRNVQCPDFDWLPKTSQTQTRKQPGHPQKEGHVYAKVKELVEHIPLEPYKELPLDGRGRVSSAISCKRKAELHIGSIPICMYRQAKRNKKYIKTERLLEVNLVVIKELNPPEGQKPLCWLLLTNKEVDTLDQMAYVGRIYELRWKIEEFFRLLKTAYRLEHARYDSAEKIARYLILITVSAQTLMKIKELAGINSATLSDEEFARVSEAMKKPEDKKIDLNLRIFALIARRGGWLGRRRDPIGTTILARGMMDILTVLQFQQEHQELLTELQAHPEKLFQFGRE